MTQTNVTPTPTTNQPTDTTQPIDNMGNPVNPDGTPVEPKTEDTPDGGETVESLKKALNDTKAELTRLQQNKPKEDEGDDKEQTPPTDLSIKEKEAEEAGIDFGKYSEEFAKDGKLSEDSYKELTDKGYDKQIVDDYIAGQQARAAQETAKVAEVVGGVEKLDTVLAWAAENMSEAEIAAYNTSINNGTDAARIALEGINARYVAANGSAPNLINGKTGVTPGDVFKSPYEMTKAMEDPKYWSDPDYQKEVQAKLSRSMKAGTV